MRCLLVCLLTISLSSCTIPLENEKPTSPTTKKYPLTGIEAVLANDSLWVSGGYGSDIFPHPTKKDAYYLLTDRGPNYDWKTADRSPAKGFAAPGYTPRIGLFELRADSFLLVKDILLKGPDSLPLTGLPNPPGRGGTDEKAFDINGKQLNNDPNGIDPEGLVVMENGDFWVSDEYGPYLMRFDSNGVMKEKLSPYSFPEIERYNELPTVFAKRRPNRGMEGLTITPDGSKLVGIMQSSLYNPDISVKTTSRICRILTYDLASGKTQQYAFVQEAPGLANSGICAISNDRFLVIERDNYYVDYGGEVALSTTIKYSRFKAVVEIDISGATDISDPEDQALGLQFDGKTIEQLADQAGLDSVGIKPVKKKLLLDLRQGGIPYVHDKAEGVFYLAQDSLIGIVNDNDYAITGEKNKVLPKRQLNGEVDVSWIYLFKLEN